MYVSLGVHHIYEVQRHAVDVTLISATKARLKRLRNNKSIVLRSSLLLSDVPIPAFYFYDVKNYVGHSETV